MWVGFALARVFPVWLSVVVVIALEVIAMMAVRDGLVLNVLSFVWPMESIVEWQAGAYPPAVPVE
jgi:hypothetical protein